MPPSSEAWGCLLRSASIGTPKRVWGWHPLQAAEVLQTYYNPWPPALPGPSRASARRRGAGRSVAQCCSMLRNVAHNAEPEIPRFSAVRLNVAQCCAMLRTVAQSGSERLTIPCLARGRSGPIRLTRGGVAQGGPARPAAPAGRSGRADATSTAAGSRWSRGTARGNQRRRARVRRFAGSAARASRAAPRERGWRA